MKIFWDVIGIIFTVIALAGNILTVVYLGENLEAVGGFAGILRNLAVTATLMATVAILWVIRYQVGENEARRREEAARRDTQTVSEAISTPAPAYTYPPQEAPEATVEITPEETREIERQNKSWTNKATQDAAEHNISSIQ